MPPITEWAARIEEQARRPLVLLALVALLLVYGGRQASRKMGDFEVYRRAAERAVAGETAYRLSDPHRYLYAPIVTFLFFPIAVLPKTLGKIFWLGVNFAVIVSILRASVALVFPDGRAPPGFHAIVLLLSSRFIDNNVGHGQINLILLWLVLQAYALARDERYPLAGIALAAAIATKLVPVVFLVQIVLERRWRFALWTVLGFAALMAAPVVWWGASYPGIVRDWAAVVADQAGHYDIGNKINQSISAFTYRLFGMAGAEDSGARTVATATLHLGFLVPLILVALRRGEDANASMPRRADELALWLLYSTVAAPYSWKYYFANLMFAFAAITPRLWTADRRRFAIALAAVFVLNTAAGIELPGETAERWLEAASLHFVGVVILFALLVNESPPGVAH